MANLTPPMTMATSSSHIVDELIEERAQHLMQHPRLWKLIQKLIYPLLGYRKAVHAVDTVQAMGGYDVFDWVSQELSLTVDASNLGAVPKEGLCFVMPNHPAGMADGIAIYDALRTVRSDIVFFANRDCIRVAPGLADIIIPVEWRNDERGIARNRETVRSMSGAFRAGKLVVIFPAGRMSKPSITGLHEQPWFDSAVNLALKVDAPIVPCHINARSSWLFYALWYLNTELKDMTLFRELLEKAGYHYRLTFADAFTPTGDATKLTEALQAFVEGELKRGHSERFKPPSL